MEVFGFLEEEIVWGYLFLNGLLGFFLVKRVKKVLKQFMTVSLSYQNTPIFIGTFNHVKIDFKTTQLNL